MRVLWYSALLLAAASILGGCESTTTDPETLSRLVIGEIDITDTDQPVIEAPDTAFAGELVRVTVSTVGNSCIAAAGAEVLRRDLDVTITPYDQESIVGGCLDFRMLYPRVVHLDFPRSGDATIRVRGRRVQPRGFVTVEHVMTITPPPAQ